MAEDRTGTVLLVEDDDDAQAIYGSWLTHVGWNVSFAPTISRANEVVYERRPDVVVLDCRLPDGSGLDLLERWKRSPWMGDIPVIVLTAFGAPPDQALARKRGADVFLVKPCTGETLASHVAALSQSQPPAKRSTGRMRALRALEPPSHGLHTVDATRFQARCSRCYRSSPMIAGSSGYAAKKFLTLDWRVDGRRWACPICVARALTRPPPAK
jgi:DNA-binding response OmpR family regulator